MTLRSMVDEVKASLGNRTDITDQRYLSWLNWAYYDVCGFHKKQLLGPKMFRFLEGRTSFQAYIGHANVVSAFQNTITFDFSDGAPVAPMVVGEGWVIEISNYNQYSITASGAQNDNKITGSGFSGVVNLGDVITCPYNQKFTVTSVSDTQIGIDKTISAVFNAATVTGYNPLTIPQGLIGQKATVVSASYTNGHWVATVMASTGLGNTNPLFQWDIMPDSQTMLTLYRRYYYIGIDFDLPVSLGKVVNPQYANMRLWAVDTLYYLKDGQKLDHLEKEAIPFSDLTELGMPSQFYRVDDLLIFSVTPDNTYTFELLYYAYPRTVNYDQTGAWAGLSYDIDDYWHEVIIKAAIWRGHDKLMEPDRADMARTVYQEAMLEHFDSEQVEGKQVHRSVRMNFFGSGSYTIGNGQARGNASYDRADFVDK